MPESSFYPPMAGDILSRANMFRWIREFCRASQIEPGYYLEFGVCNGESMIEAYRMLRGYVTHYFGFDTFSGLPALSPEDEASHGLMPTFGEGELGGMSRPMVHDSIVAKTRMDPAQLKLVEGAFADSLPAFDRAAFDGRGPCSVCYVDCDLYSSSKQVFEFVEPLLVTGTWLLLDDYWCYRGSPKYGQRRAFEEWISASKRIGASDYGNFKGFGRAFVVYEK